MTRGEVYDARLDPVEGSEQRGIRPVVIVSRDATNAVLDTVIAVPCSSYRPGRRVFVTQVMLHAPESGLRVDSVALGEQVRVVLEETPSPPPGCALSCRARRPGTCVTHRPGPARPGVTLRP